MLLVDDEPVMLRSLSRVFKRIGFDTVAVEDAEKALQHIEAETRSPNLVVLDLDVPGISGEDALRVLRRRLPEVPVICISGYAEEAFRTRLGESDDIHFLPKPFSLAQLAGKVKEVMTG